MLLTSLYFPLEIGISLSFFKMKEFVVSLLTYVKLAIYPAWQWIKELSLFLGTNSENFCLK